MDLLMAFLVFAGAMIAVLVWGAEYGMLLALGVGAAGFYLVARHRGFDSADLVRMMAKGMRRSLLVVRILVLVGAMTALWRAGGTIAFFVVQGTRLIPPGMFLLAAFLLTAVMAYALGTSFGVTGTMGVILVTLARSGGVPVAMTAGAVLSGAYFGDRTAPASSCANLVATVCGVPIYDHVHRCLRSAAVPMLLCTAAYAALFVTALGSAMLFCNQTIAILMCQQLLGPVYQREGCTAGETALDLSDSAAVLVALCPWCVACAVPLEMLGVGLEALPWAGFLWLLPLCRLVGERMRLGRKKGPPVGKIC